MLISGLGTIAFGVAGIINANQAAAQVSKEMAFLFFGSFSTTMAYFTKDRLMTG